MGARKPGSGTPAAERDAALEALADRGLDQGCLNLSEAEDAIRRLGLDDEAAEEFLGELQNRGVDIRDDCGSERTESSTYANGDLATATADAVGIFLNELRRFPLLTAKEEVELAQRIERGDREARDRMINSNLRLVVSVARRYQNQGLSLLDLIQEGVLGLIRAVDKFDWRRGYKFSTYATWWVRQAVQKGVQTRGREIRMPSNVLEVERKMARAEPDLAQRLRRTPTDEELAEVIDVRPSEVHAVRSAARAVTSLDKPVGDEDATSLSQLIPHHEPGPEDIVTVSLTRQKLREAMDSLPERERQVIALHFDLDGEGRPLTVREIARRLRLTARQVQELEAQALERLALNREIQAVREAA